MFTLENFVEILTKRMKEKGYSGRQLAMEAGLNPSAVRDILNRKSHDPGISKIVALADALECSVDTLVRDAPPISPIDQARLTAALQSFDKALNGREIDREIWGQCISDLYIQMESLRTSPKLVQNAVQIALEDNENT